MSEACNPYAQRVAETTTIRIPLSTRERLNAYRTDELQSVGDVVHWLTQIVPTRNNTTIARDRIRSYLSTHLLPRFGDADELTPGEALWKELTQLQYRGATEEHAATAVILDHTALAKLAIGNRLIAQLIYASPHHLPRRIYAPSQAVYTAAVQHTGIQRHIERLAPTITTCDFGLAAALTVGEKVPTNVTPAVAHVVHEALPSMEWPAGRPVITTVPQMYAPYQLQVRALPENEPPGSHR